MPIANSSDHFIVNGHQIENTMADFLKWSYSDLSEPTVRSAIAEYIVASALDLTSSEQKRYAPKKHFYDLMTHDGFRLCVRSAAYLESVDSEQPVRISFGTTHIFSSTVVRPDAYVFCLFKGMSADDSPLNLDLWDFYALNHSVIAARVKTKTITLPSLLRLEPLWSDYYGLATAIESAVNG